MFKRRSSSQKPLKKSIASFKSSKDGQTTSDPTARRGDNIKRLLAEMRKTTKGWTENQIKNFLFMQYRYGITEQTLDRIFGQLKDRGVIYAKHRKSPPFLLFYPVTEAEEKAREGIL